MATPQKKPDAMTVSRFSSMMNCDRHELARKVTELKAAPLGSQNGGQLFALRDLVLAFAGGDERAERIRRTRAEAERLELQNARTRGELVEVSKVIEAGEKVMAAARAKILTLPITDPEKHAILMNFLSLRKIEL